MAYTRTFEEYIPPRRYDGLPFTQALIRESATETGAYTTIDTKTLLPVDADPSDPATRNFTTALATLATGWYIIRWQDAGGAVFDSDPVLYDASAPSDPLGVTWRPTVEQIASILRARTKVQDSGEVGTFTVNTRPTASEVEDLITEGTTSVAAWTGTTFAEEALEARAKDLAILYTAMLIEISYFPEQVGTESSPYEQLLALYQSGMVAFREEVAESGGATFGTGVYSVQMQPDIDAVA